MCAAIRARAAEALASVHQFAPDDIALAEELADAWDQAGEPQRAAPVWEWVAARGEEHARRRLCSSWLRAADPRGGVLLQELLEEHEGDPELTSWAEGGPPLVPVTGYQPTYHDDHAHAPEPGQRRREPAFEGAEPTQDPPPGPTAPGLRSSRDSER